MEIKSFYETESGTWTYLVADPDAGQAVIIDPVWVYNPAAGTTSEVFIDKVLEAARESGWQVKWVFETHAHADHLSAGSVVRELTGARIAIGRGITRVQRNFARAFNRQEAPTDGSQFDRLLDEGDVIEMGALRFRALHTPGHTDDSMTYLVNDAAFIGDTLFRPDAGTARCDFPGGSASRLYDSIQKIYALPEATRLFLCHDYPAEGQSPRDMVPLSEAREHNVHVQHDTPREAFIERREARDKQLGMPRLIMQSVQVNVLAGNPPAPEDNGFSYLKIPFNTSFKALLKQEP